MAFPSMAFPSMWVWGVSCPAMAYVYYGVLRLPKGCIRLAASLPLIAFYVCVAKGFETVFERGTYSFFFIWLTSFKIVLLCWDDGPAADPWAVASFPRFLAVMTLSLQIKREKFGDRKKVYLRKSKEDSNGTVVLAQDRKSSAAIRNGLHLDGTSKENGSDPKFAQLGDTERKNPTESGWKALLKSVDESQDWHMVVVRLLFKFVILMLITGSYSYRALMPVGLLYVVYSLHIYVSCSLIFEGIAALVSPMMGIELEPAFNKPFLAHCLTDFWGQRWNLLVSNLMRVSIYDPVLRFLLGPQGRHSAHLVKPDSNTRAISQEQAKDKMTLTSVRTTPLWARSIAMLAVFLVSGLMHELIFHYLTRNKPTGEVTLFFVLNGAASLLELAIRRKSTRVRLPRYVGTPLTLGFVLGTAIWLFYPPLLRGGTADIAIAEFEHFFQKLYHAGGASQHN